MAAVSVTVHYLVVEEGVYTAVQHGVQLQAWRTLNTVTDRKGSWAGQAQTYGQAFAQSVVIGQVRTANDPEFSAFWCRGSSWTSPTSSMQIFTGKSVAEDPNTTRANETIGVIVVDAGTGLLGGPAFTAGLGVDTVVGTGDARSLKSYTLSGLG